MIRIYNQNVWGHLFTSNRPQLIKQMIYDFSADLCSFQECNSHGVRHGENDIGKLLADSYAEAPVEAGINNYTPVFYKKDRFNLLDSGWHLFSGLNDVNSKSVTWALLQEKSTDNKLIFMSTHFWWKVESEEDIQQRMENARELYELMTVLYKKYDVPIIFAGDLNCGKGSSQGEGPIQRLYDLKLINLKDIADVSRGSFTHHEYPPQDENGIFHRAGLPVRTLDHAFMLPDERIHVKSYVIDESDIALTSSDHCPIKIEIEYINN